MPPRELPPPARPAPRNLGPEDFEAIREAVMETPRGRWFLDQYAQRLRQAEAAGLTESMRRLESLISANHDSIMSRLAAALEEGEEAADTDPPPAPEAGLAPRHMKYYRADEDLFEPAPEAAIAPVPRLVEAAREAEIQPPRRRIVFIRHKPGEPIDVPLADDMARAS